METHPYVVDARTRLARVHFTADALGAPCCHRAFGPRGAGVVCIIGSGSGSICIITITLLRSVISICIITVALLRSVIHAAGAGATAAAVGGVGADVVPAVTYPITYVSHA